MFWSSTLLPEWPLCCWQNSRASLPSCSKLVYSFYKPFLKAHKSKKVRLITTKTTFLGDTFLTAVVAAQRRRGYFDSWCRRLQSTWWEGHKSSLWHNLLSHGLGSTELTANPTRPISQQPTSCSQIAQPAQTVPWSVGDQVFKSWSHGETFHI